MNQIQIQHEIRKEQTLDKARVIAAAKRVRKTSNRNIWLVGSGNPKTPTKFYAVTWNDEEIGCFMCDCKAFEFSSDNPCKHILSIALKETS